MITRSGDQSPSARQEASNGRESAQACGVGHSGFFHCSDGHTYHIDVLSHLRVLSAPPLSRPAGIPGRMCSNPRLLALSHLSALCLPRVVSGREPNSRSFVEMAVSWPCYLMTSPRQSQPSTISFARSGCKGASLGTRCFSSFSFSTVGVMLVVVR